MAFYFYKSKPILYISILLLLICILPHPLTARAGFTVYVTRTGEKYHLRGCSYLKSSISKELEDAIHEGYAPCSRCKPPTLENVAIYTGEKYYSSNTPKYSASLYSRNDYEDTSSYPSSVPGTGTHKSTADKEKSVKVFETEDVIGICGAGLILASIARFIIMRKKDNKNQISKDEYNYYFSCYAFFPPEYFCNIPNGAFIRNGLPCSNRYGMYGRYTVYISNSGKCYHQKKKCLRTHNICEHNIVTVLHSYKPCSKCCNKELPDLAWYYEWKRISDIKKKHSIP